MLVAVGGIDGAGKTTLVANVGAALGARQLSVAQVKVALFANRAFQRYKPTLKWVQATNQPAGGWLRAALVVAETLHVIQEEVVPALATHDVVICDRYLEGTACYLEARRLPGIEYLQALAATCPVPDLAILLDVPLETACRRLVNLGEEPSPDQVVFLQTMQDLLHSWARNSGAVVLNGRKSIDELTDVVVDLIVVRSGTALSTPAGG